MKSSIFIPLLFDLSADLLCDLLRLSCHRAACSLYMTAAAEALGNPAHINLRVRPEAHLIFVRISRLIEQEYDLDRKSVV